jgi:branched-chain amino acid transport system permease protein
MTDFLQFLVAGVAQGAIYALVALGFVIIYKATGVINFAQGALVMVGAYICWELSVAQEMGFYLAALIAVIASGFIGWAIEAVILRRMVGRPVFAVIMITIGLAIVAQHVVIWKWSGLLLNLDDPWGLGIYRVNDVVIAKVDVVTIIATGILIAAFFLLFRYSRLGVAMRATASDQEAALAQGISARRINGLSWAIAGAIGGLAGILLTSGGQGVSPEVELVALVAFPAIILGGLDSPGGSVFGGVIIGIVQVMTSGYAARLPDFLGTNFQRVSPYVVLVLILMIRPYGLFGTKEVTRV